MHRLRRFAMRVAVAVPAVFGALVAGCESSPTEPVTTRGAPLPRAVAITAAPTQAAADDISSNVQNLHLVREFPHPTIVDPRFASSDPTDLPAYETVVGYAHAGDAAIWTGHYLAAEALRFAVTRSPAAL